MNIPTTTMRSARSQVPTLGSEVHKYVGPTLGYLKPHSMIASHSFPHAAARAFFLEIRALLASSCKVYASLVQL